MSKHGWIIDRETVTDEADRRQFAESGGREGLCSRVGWTGPQSIPPELVSRLEAGEGIRFQMSSDLRGAGDHIDYEGRVLTTHPDVDETLNDENALIGPLLELGMPDVGSTTIRHWVDGQWQLIVEA